MANWDASVNGKAIAWSEIHVTLEQFHVPGRFSITCPVEGIDVPTLLADQSPEVVIRADGKEFFVGVLDDSNGVIDEGEGIDGEPEDTVTLTGTDLSGLFRRKKIVTTLPTNQTASEMAKGFFTAAGLTDLSQVTATSDPIGEFIKHNYHHVTRGLSQHDVLFDLAELEHFVFRVNRRTPFFGPQPAPATSRDLVRARDFNHASWNKNHTNQDVTVRVLSWNPNTKKRVAQTAGSGDLVITLIRPGMTPLQAKNLANRALEEAERGLVTVNITGMPGDPTQGDVLTAFRVSGIAPGIDQTYYPRQITHIITQDDHTMDLALYNSARITA